MMKKVLKGRDLASRVDLEEKVRKTSFTHKTGILEGTGAVLNKKVMEARDRANDVLKGAQNEAELIRQEAEKMFSQVKAEMEKARAKGLAAGREEGFSSVTEQIVRFEKMKEDFYADAEPNIIKLIMTISEKIVGKMVNEHREAIKSIVVQAVEKSLGEKITVRLSPEDYNTLKNQTASFEGILDRTKRIVFKEDETVSRGGCLVETEVGTIDARLETQLSAIRKALEL